MNLILFYLKTFFKTLYFNFKLLPPRDAISIPFLISGNCHLANLKGKIILHEKSFLCVKIGFGNVGIFDKQYGRTIINLSGTIEFRGKAYLGHGSKLSVGGILVLGENFKISAESSIVCEHKISFGSNCLISWDCLFIDNDFHDIYDLSSRLKINKSRPILIGDNVWFCSRCTILKGVEISNDCVVGASSVISGSFKANSLIAGSPAVVIRNNIYWEH